MIILSAVNSGGVRGWSAFGTASADTQAMRSILAHFPLSLFDRLLNLARRIYFDVATVMESSAWTICFFWTIASVYNVTMVQHSFVCSLAFVAPNLLLARVQYKDSSVGVKKAEYLPQA